MCPKTRLEQARDTLTEPEVHQEWFEAYHSSDNNTFFDLIFRYILDEIGITQDSLILDAGCGYCEHSIRLAKCGYVVHAIDFSEHVLGQAVQRIASTRLESMISLCQADLLQLPYSQGTYDCVFCWGVLMHIPELDDAIAELARVLKPGGYLVLSENNQESLQFILLKSIRKALGREIFGKEKMDLRELPSGIDQWVHTSSGPLLTRHTNMKWLTKRLQEEGLIVHQRISGNLTNAYAGISSKALQRAIHWINRFWFRYIGLPGPAQSNILILQKAPTE